MSVDKDALLAKYIAETGMTVPAEFLGSALLMSPFSNYISSQRLSMFSNHLSQFVPITGSEFPRIFTGWENIFGKMGFAKDERGCDVIIQDVIPKHQITPSGCKDNNLNLIIATSCDTGEIIIFEMNNYPDSYHKFGERYSHPYGIPTVHSHVDKDAILTKSSMWDDKGYGMGTNTTVLYASLPEVSEDAVVISEELAEKLKYSQLKKYTAKISVNDILLNRYGDVDDYKAFPDVGETVNSDGVLFAIRKNANKLDISDVTVDSLEKLQIHDDKVLAEPGSEIIDVVVDVPNRIRKECVSEEFIQLNKYADMRIRYYNRIVETITSLMDARHTLSPMANTIMTEALGRIREADSRNRSQLKLAHKNEQLDYYYLSILVKTDYEVGITNKVTGRHGEKGIIGAIWPTENMPINEYGERAHIILPPDSPSNRLNPGQFLEQTILGCAERIRARAQNREYGDIHDTYRVFIEFLYDVAPRYAKLVQEHTHSTPDEFVNTVLNEGFYIRIPPYSDKEYDNIYGLLKEKYGYTESKYSYYITVDGERKLIAPDDPGIIGGKYIYLMDSTPDKHITASSIGYTSQFNTPVKAKSKRVKSMNLINTTPLRIGEDETSILSMMVGVEACARIEHMYSHSPTGSETMATALLTAERPSDIGRIDISDEELIAGNTQTAIANHFLGIGGIKHVHIKEENEE